VYSIESSTSTFGLPETPNIPIFRRKRGPAPTYRTQTPTKMSFEGKVVAITGAASGIGLALAKLLGSKGAKLALADVQHEALDKAVSEIKSSGGDAVGTRVDVSKDSEVDQWINDTVKHFGKLNGAANIAGVEGKHGVFTNFIDMKNEEWDYIISINLTGLMYCLRAELRVMEKGASIVNAASIAGLMGRPGIGAYSVSKHGVVGLTKTAAKEVGPQGIRVNAVAP
jgi:NAD(P)-dependent dehydrogenase (short-subunit alcohol dehydrogenase family)